MPYRPHRRCLLLCSRTHGMLAFNAKSSPGDAEEQGVQRWLFCFCFHENSHVLCNICIENIPGNVLLLSKASLALLGIDVPASLCFPLYQSSSLTAHLLYFRSARRFRPALCDLASRCMSSDAMLNALATDAGNLLWHRVRPFCAAE